ncbi:actin-like protein ARP6 [Dendrothele bispora CBS 962.96]|uniref:Actin-like protein ARP6 n=1 Tax=Dendrothele bispora (strain CBS 962.96) TaxID=1314807 RepID=A0A4S8LT33_DENBC|nr:actin-like protein ARP6 [Dendrothele bispora CBS 962.96]
MKLSNNIVILDNGAFSIKTGTTSSKTSKKNTNHPRVIPNAIVRSKGDKTTYFGHEIENCRDYSSLHYRLPFEKGYIVDWDAQKAIWDGVFSDQILNINTTESSLILTEPYFNLPNIQEVYDQFVFEEYEFSSYHRCTPASLIPYGTLFNTPDLLSSPPECMVIVDSGFSFTHVVPILNGNVVWGAVKRLDVGGKLLTNQLKELVSYRQWNMMDETFIMNDVKETCCYVSENFSKDLETARLDVKSNPIVQEYILPDMSTNRRGHVRQLTDIVSDSDQILFMNNERFTVPEIIFRPDDIGLDQSGLAATISVSISLLPEDLQGMFWANIGLIGGNCKFPGFRKRLLSELQSLVPEDNEIVIYECNDPITEAYHSALSFATGPHFSGRTVTRAEYQESGTTRRKFRDWKNPPPPPPIDHRGIIEDDLTQTSNDERPPPVQATGNKSIKSRVRGNVPSNNRPSRR